MSYAKRDYNAISTIIRVNLAHAAGARTLGEREAAETTVRSIAHGLAMYFASANERFEIERFLSDAKCPAIATTEIKEQIQ